MQNEFPHKNIIPVLCMFSLVANIQYKNTDGFSIIKVHQRAGILPTIMPEASFYLAIKEKTMD